MTQRKTTQFTMPMDPFIKEAAEQAAAQDRRSLVALIEKLLIDHCQKEGIEIRKPKRGKRQ
jgi:hypothetical protein